MYHLLIAYIQHHNNKVNADNTLLAQTTQPYIHVGPNLRYGRSQQLLFAGADILGRNEHQGPESFGGTVCVSHPRINLKSRGLKMPFQNFFREVTFLAPVNKSNFNAFVELPQTNKASHLSSIQLERQTFCYRGWTCADSYN